MGLPELFVEGGVALHVGRDQILQHPTPTLREKRPYICPTSPYINAVGKRRGRSRGRTEFV